MFVGRERELEELRSELTVWNRRSAILIYGKRRVGKSTLIREAAMSFDGVVVNHQCVASTFEGNLEMIYQSVSEALDLPDIRFGSLQAMMEYLKTTGKRILLIIDEYPYLKQGGRSGEADSHMQRVIDELPDNVKLILCGSYITVMKELLTEENPLFGRFSLIQHIHEFDYYHAAEFYPEMPVREKIASYAVFGGSPYVLENLDTKASLRENIEKFLLTETGLVRSHIENVMLKEIQKNYDIRILAAIGNGKKKYAEIHSILGGRETGNLDKQLKILLDMETIRKTEPINRHNDKKKQFYEIVDNLMGFYFTYVFGRAGTVGRIGEKQFYNRYIQETAEQFISKRLENICLQYFHRQSVRGEMKDIEDFGTYWYDDPETHTNGEFDCVIKRAGDLYDFYECKYYKKPMSKKECREEKEQLQQIKGIEVSGIGFICSSGFDFDDPEGLKLITGDDLYETDQQSR